MAAAIHGPLLAGVDEAGRGPLAGPVAAAAVILDPRRPIAGLRDSKQLTAQQRSRLALLIRERAGAFALGVATVEEIDCLNILQATLLAMRRALQALAVRPSRIIIDGNKAPHLDDLFEDCRVETLVRADVLVPAVGAASILAKTWRDAHMAELDALYPGFELARHQGYPTAAHLAALARLGPSPVHRRSFAPVRSLLSHDPELRTPPAAH
ncbi:MAG: ribonuclease HII [Gammaproteobacteria bacterium]|nr:ribonuclease HII [Gammaproteobacteria bacterium]